VNPSHEALRMKAYLERSPGVTAFVVPRSDWESWDYDRPRVVEIDVEATPMQSLARNASLIGAVACEGNTRERRISIYRYDGRDMRPVNTDHYFVLTDLASHPELDRLVKAASTERNDNLDRYLQEHVLIVKEEPGPDHWLLQVPSTVAVVLSRSRPDV
jgi:hypothetical protein